MGRAKDRPRRSRSRRRWPIILLLIGIVTGATLGIVITLLIHRPHDREPGAWISGFLQTSGFAGVCALGAASLAFIGLNRQMLLTRRSMLQSQRNVAREQIHARKVLLNSERVEATRSWWERFEWVTSRALPSSKTDKALPAEALLLTFAALLDEAKADGDKVREAAANSISDLVVQASRGRDADTASDHPAAEEADPEANSTGHRDPTDVASGAAAHGWDGAERLLYAMTTLSAASSGTQGRSTQVDARLYELQVFDALTLSGLNVHQVRHQSPKFQKAPVDAEVRLSGVRIAVGLKGWTDRTTVFPQRFDDLVANYRSSGSSHPFLVISRAGAGVTVSASEPAAAHVTWRPGDSPAILREAATTLSQLSARPR